MEARNEGNKEIVLGNRWAMQVMLKTINGKGLKTKTREGGSWDGAQLFEINRGRLESIASCEKRQH